MDTERCKKLVATIQQLEQTEVEELFKMLHANGCHYTSNNHGVFMNLSWLTEDILQKMETYVAFCVRSRHEVQKYESLCDVLNRNIQQNTKTKQTAPVDNQAVKEDKVALVDKKAGPASKVSSSMKFYLLKKRYAKQNTSSGNAKNELVADDHT